FDWNLWKNGCPSRPKIAQFTKSPGRSGTPRFARSCYQTTITRVPLRVSASSRLGTSKRMAHTLSARMFEERMILATESHFRDQLELGLIERSFFSHA